MTLKSYSFLPLSALLWSVVSAHAGVIYSGYKNIAIPQNFDGLYLNVTTGATSFTQPADWNSSSWINPIFGGVWTGSSERLRPMITGSDQILNLSTGTLVSNASTFATGESGSTTHVGEGAGQLTLGQAGYMGFQFETSPGGTTQYGWLNTTISNTGAGVIRDWGFEAAEGSIVVGRIEQSAPSGGSQVMTLSPGAGESFTLSSVVTDTGGNYTGIAKTGAGTVTLTSNNAYTGPTVVVSGTLDLNGAAGALTATSNVVISEGTLLLSGPAVDPVDRINNAAFINLGGYVGSTTNSKLQLSGAVTETLGALRLGAGSEALVIDFGSTSGELTFASLSADPNQPLQKLQIWNWSGTTGTGGGMDQLIISNGILGGSLAASDISFFNGPGTGLYSGATTFTFTGELVPGELVPVPEASTLLAVLGLIAPLAWRERRHWMRCREARG
jgi:autotransporter-associated beta strand protein